MVALPAFGVLVGDANTSPDAALTVIGERDDRSPVNGLWAGDTLKIKTESATIDFSVAKVRQVTFRIRDDGAVVVSVELADHSRYQGQLLTEKIRLKIGDQIESLPPQALRQLKFVQPVSHSLTAIILGLVTLSLMEIVLGVDNVIFLAILVGKLPKPQQRLARNIGLGAALGTRILLLFSLTWLLRLTNPLFTLPELPFLVDPEARDISLRDLILLLGGLFLVAKSVKEVHEKMAAAAEHRAGLQKASAPAKFASVIIQIAIIDIIFSLDSVITAVGMVEDVWIMITAMVIAMLVMLVFARLIGDFVDRNPAIKILALSFLILIGVLLMAESLGQHMDKGYIYFAMAFAVVIELINMRLRPAPATA
jgi:predicted tellurium resistance membrane protein TerC